MNNNLINVYNNFNFNLYQMYLLKIYVLIFNQLFKMKNKLVKLIIPKNIYKH